MTWLFQSAYFSSFVDLRCLRFPKQVPSWHTTILVNLEVINKVTRATEEQRMENVMFAVLELEAPNWPGIAAGRDMMDVRKELARCHQNTIPAWLRKVNDF